MPLTKVLRGTKVELHVPIARAEGDDRLGVAGAVNILAICVGCLTQNLLGRQAIDIGCTEGSTTPVRKKGLC